MTFAHDHAVRIFDKLVATYVGFPEGATHLNQTLHAHATGVSDTHPAPDEGALGPLLHADPPSVPRVPSRVCL